MNHKLVTFLAVLFVLFSCRSVPVPPKTAAVPTNLPTALERARAEFSAGRVARAWTLVANQGESTPAKQSFLDEARAALSAQLEEAKTKNLGQKVSDLENSLLLISGKTWEPAPPVIAPASLLPPSEWLKGTVTVIVNKGLKLENGGAVPDIVIGSGFFISADGYLLTNHHVIESEVEPGAASASHLSVRLPDSKGEKLPAKVIGWDRNLDLALLKVEYKPPFVFQLGSDTEASPGLRLRALGSPGGLEATLTEGIVSALHRPLLALGDVLQVDVAVNPGNSGGPLVDAGGRVVGIVYAGVQAFQGVNFAIPVGLVQKVLPRLKAGGKLSLGWVGLGLQEDAQGLEVLYVAPRSPADWAGVQVGDRLLSVAGKAVKELAEAQNWLLYFGSDAIIPLDVSRGGKVHHLWSTVEARPDFPLKDAAVNDLAARVLPLAFGVVVEDTASGVDRSFRVSRVWAGTSAEELQLAENDPLEVLEWVADTENKALVTRWKVKRRLGGYLESIVQLGVSFGSRQFL